jgi:hypothetical protein
MYLAHFCGLIRKLLKSARAFPITHGEDTNTLEASNVLVEILCIRGDFVSSCDRCLQYILGRTVLEVCAVGDVNWSAVSVERLIDLRVFEVVVLELYRSANARSDSMIDRFLPSSSMGGGLWLSSPWFPSRRSHTLVHACTS